MIAFCQSPCTWLTQGAGFSYVRVSWLRVQDECLRLFNWLTWTGHSSSNNIPTSSVLSASVSSNTSSLTYYSLSFHSLPPVSYLSTVSSYYPPQPPPNKRLCFSPLTNVQISKLSFCLTNHVFSKEKHWQFGSVDNMSIIRSESESSSADLLLCLCMGFDSDWRLHLARNQNCVLCSSFPGNDFSGR